MASSWAKKIGSGLLWSGAGFAASKVLTFVSLLVLARLLTPSQFGVVAAITLFVAVIELVSDLGMKAVVVYEQEEGITDRVRTAFTMNLLFAVALTGVGLLLAPLVAMFFRLEDETDLFRLAVLNLLLAGLGNIHDAMLLREIDFRRRIRPEIVRGILRGTVAITLAAMGFGAVSLIWGLLAGTAIWVVALWIMVPLRPRFVLDRAIARSMVSYGSAAMAHSFLSEIGRFADAGAIGRVLGERALGIYTVALRVPELVIRNVSWNVSIVLFPALSKRRATDGDESLSRTTLELVRLQGLYVMPAAAGLAVLGTPLVVVLFSSTWVEAGTVMAALSLVAALDTLLSPLGDGMKASGKQRWLVWLNLVHLPILIAAVVIAAPYGIKAVAWALVGQQALFAAWLFMASVRVLQIRSRDIVAALYPGMMAGLGAAVCAEAVRRLWDVAEVLPVALATLAGILGAVAFLRVFASATFAELAGALRGVLPSAAARPQGT